MKKSLQPMMSSGTDDWRTPPWLFEELHTEFKFSIDAAAAAPNLLPRYWGAAEDGASQDWIGERVFCNPPYTRGVQDRFLARAARCDATVAVMLLPVRTSTRAWHAHLLPTASEIRFVRGRLRFVGAKHDAPFPSVIAVFERGGRQGPIRVSSFDKKKVSRP